MSDLFTKIKRKNVEPSVYAIVARSQTFTVLHLGIHHSLDEAMKVAFDKLEASLPASKKKEYKELYLSDVIPATRAIAALVGQEALEFDGKKIANNRREKTLEELLADIQGNKNDLMKKVIDSKDPSLLKSMSKFFSKNESRLIEEKIQTHVDK